VAVWLDDLQEAKALALKENKDLFVWFGASDWAEVDVLFRKSHLTKRPFIEYAQKHFILVDMDTPQYKPRTSAFEVAQRLKDDWQIKGYPTLVMADAQGRRYAGRQGVRSPRKEGEVQAAVTAYVRTLEGMRRARLNRDEMLARAATTQGLAKARWLADALNNLPGAYLADYADQVREIRRLDADNAAGLRSRYDNTEIAIRRKEAEARLDQRDWPGSLNILNGIEEEVQLTVTQARAVWQDRVQTCARSGQ